MGLKETFSQHSPHLCDFTRAPHAPARARRPITHLINDTVGIYNIDEREPTDGALCSQLSCVTFLAAAAAAAARERKAENLVLGRHMSSTHGSISRKAAVGLLWVVWDDALKRPAIRGGEKNLATVKMRQ